MKPVVLALLISLAPASGLVAQNPEPVRAQPIRGQVVDARTGVPLRRARVVVSAAQRPVDSVFTDEEGRFAIANMPATPLTVRASKAGYAVSLVTLPVSGADTDLRFALTKSAAVSGRVIDSIGAPASSVSVRAQALVPSGSNIPTGLTQFLTQTDLLGEYRLGNLPAGRYEITAVRVRPDKRLPNTRPEEQLFGPPDALDMARATAMSLAPGDEARDVDFSIAAAQETCPAGPSVRPAPGAVTASITGRVTAATGEPIPCAQVRVVTPDVSVPAVYTDRQGRYVIEGLRAGSFIVEARKSPRGSISYGQRVPSDTEAPIALRDGQRRTGVDLVLLGPGIISGTITDEYGEPIEGVQVWAFLLRRGEARVTAQMANTLPRATDDRGQYRLIGMEPGTYLIAAMGREHVSDGDAQRARGYSPRYYPGVSDASVAQRVRLAAGGSAHGVDIALTTTRTAIVSGSIVNSDGQPSPGRVTLEVSVRSGGVAVDLRGAVAGADGSFTIPNVPPGDYVVKASGAESTTQFGMQYVTVVDADPAPARIVLSGGATLEGRLVIDGVSEPNIAGLGVSLSPAESDYAPSGRTLPTMWARQSDNTFRATGVTGPNRLTITPTPACESCYLKSALINGTDAADRPFEFGVGGGVYRDVEIVVSDAGAMVDARASDGSNGSVTSFWLVVFPTARELWYQGSRHLKAQRTRGDGAARVTGLPPGDYYVAAVNRFEPMLFGDLSDPDVLEELSRGAQQVTLNERDRRTLTLRLIRRQGNQP